MTTTTRYRVLCKLTCGECENSWLADDSEVYAEDINEAQRKFKAKYRLCHICGESGKQIGVEFHSLIHVEAIPRDSVKAG